LAALVPGGADAAGAWPDPRYGGPTPLVLLARSHLHGLRAALRAIQQWASHDVPPIELAGAVIIADAPGGQHPPQDQQLNRRRAVVDEVWLIPWIEELRILAPHALRHTPTAFTRLALDLAALTSPHSQETSCC
jgi:hypothetical protein